MKGSRRQLLLVPPTAKERFLGPSWSRVRWVPASRESSLLGGNRILAGEQRALAGPSSLEIRIVVKNIGASAKTRGARLRTGHEASSFAALRLLSERRCAASLRRCSASLWLAVTIVAACAGVASASADDSRLFPYGPTAHLWLLPKCGHGSRCEALANPHTARCLPESIISERSQVEPQARQCQARQPSPIPRGPRIAACLPTATTLILL